MSRTPALMIAGTASDVGKSFLATALGRIFRQDGWNPAPFKAQNMSNNSFATVYGGEMGRAQAVQAEACGLVPHTDMNPILLKPSSETGAQVIVNGRVVGNQTAAEYFAKDQVTARESLWREVTAAYDRLAARHRPMIIEGAGSVAEVNLRDRDIVNLRVATHAGAAVFLVADIDRGGVFGSLYGTMQLLRPEERPLIKGLIVNKFRGDRALFRDGEAELARLCGVPVLGVIPFDRSIRIEEEDRLPADSPGWRGPTTLRVAVVLIPHLSNFTDFDALQRHPALSLRYVQNPQDLAEAEVVILPGSKATIADLLYLRNAGFATAILEARRRGATIIGVCGGYQMLGETISDPLGLEGLPTTVPGLGLLPVATTLAAAKTVRQVQFRFLDEAESCKGYEIHLGESRTMLPANSVRAVCQIEGVGAEGTWVDQGCFGSYVHGLFDNDAVIRWLLASHGRPFNHQPGVGRAEFQSSQYDAAAQLVRENIDLAQVYRCLGIAKNG